MFRMKRGSVLHRALSFALALALGTTLIRTGQTNAAQEESAVRAVAIAAGEYHSLALKANGTVMAWGNNAYGQTSVPAGLGDVVEVSAGANHSLALKADGTVAAWGNNYFGQTDVPDGLREVTAISAGGNYSLALKADGTIVAWGSELFDETRVPSSLPRTAKLSAGRAHSLALSSDGQVKAWGLADNNRTQVPASLNRAIAVSAGGFHSMALQADGTIVAWGYNVNRQTAVPAGLGKVAAIAAGRSHSLALLANGAVEAWGSDTYGQANVPPNARSGVKAIAAGEYHSLALKADGTIVTWGYPYYGLMDVPADTSSFVKAIAVSAGRYHSLALLANGAVEAWGSDTHGQANVPSDAKSGVKAIAAGAFHSLALKADGTVVAWGDDSEGQASVPAGLDGVKAISAGAYHSLALKADGSIVAWGDHSREQTNVPSDSDGATAVFAGEYHSLALKADGTVAAWGTVYWDGQSGAANVPEGLNGVTAISSGAQHAYAIRVDGTFVRWAWAQTDAPAVASGAVAVSSKLSHALVLKAGGTLLIVIEAELGAEADPPANLNRIVAVSAGDYHSLALKADGSIVAWGLNEFGQTGVPGDSALTDLTMQEGPFAEPFSPSVTSYTYSYFGPSTTNVKIKAILADPAYADLYIDGQPQASGSEATVNLSGDSTEIPVRVEPFFKPGLTYTITVRRDSTAPEIRFSANGNALPAATAESRVTVTDTESGTDPVTLQYVWSPSATTPDAGWTAFADGDLLTRTEGDGSWYLHVRANDLLGNAAHVVSQAFALDNTRPRATLSSSIAGGTVNAAFPVTITFDEPVHGFAAEGIALENGTLSNFAQTNSAVYTATVTPIESGLPVSVRAIADWATDIAGNGNEASEALRFMYDTTKPVVIFSVTAGQRFTVSPSSVQATVSEAVYWASNGSELNSGNALALLGMEKDGSPFSQYVAEFDEASLSFRLTFPDPLENGTYTVNVAGDAVRNASGNTLDETSASFVVAVPAVTGVIANSDRFASGGGIAEVVVSGSYMTGQTIHVSLGEAATFAANVIEDTRATAAVTLPRNIESSEKAYRLSVFVNGTQVSGLFATLIVAGRSSGAAGGSGQFPQPEADATPVIDKNGVLINPDTLDVTKPTVVLDVEPTRDGTAYVNIPASIMSDFKKQNPGLTFEIQAPYGSYRIPVDLPSLIPGLDELAVARNLEPGDIGFKITLSDKSDKKDAQAAFADSFPDGKALGPIVDFHIGIVNGRTGQTIGTAERFSEALVRTIAVSDDTAIASGRWGAFRLNETTGAFEFVPARQIRSGQFTGVEIRSYSNSVYAIARRGVSFADIGSHWGRRYILQAADKGLVNGDRSGRFSPDKPVTRAEFAEMLVRALGRGDQIGFSSPYDDVRPGSWYYGSVTRARELDLLGFASGEHFLPYRSLTREEMASALAAAVRSEQRAVAAGLTSLNAYRDIDQIDPVYLEDIRKVVQLKLMTGTAERSFSPKGEVTRAQAAAVLIRTLQSLEWTD